jgi:predicted nucleotide-binding protein (sugar kinase/HSP70/actin superfamily)
MVAEPFANLDLERRLGEMGVEVTRALYVSDWVRANLFLDTLRLKRRSRQTIVKQAASPYLGHFVGGEGLESVGESVIYSRQGYDGVIHVAPFTCMPEIVATSLLPEVGRDLGLPNMSLFLDEHTGDAGLATRLEAFVDLLARRRARLKTGAEVAAPRPLRKPSTGHTCWKSLAGGRRGSEGKPCVPWDRRGLGDDQGYRGR